MVNWSKRQIKFSSRQEVFSSLEEHMSSTYEKIKEEGQYECGQNLVKSYIIENNFQTPEEFFTAAHAGVEIRSDKIDESFYMLNVKRKGYRATFYLDSSNPRFWLLHSTYDVKNTDHLIDRLIQPFNSHLDHLWLDKRMLEDIKNTHGDYVRSIGIQYRYGDIFPTGDVGETFTMRAYGAPSEKMLRLFSKNEDISSYFAISSVGFKKEVSNAADDDIPKYEVVIEDVNFQGKFTVKGTSFHQHLDTTTDIRETYENKLLLIEEEYNISYRENKKGFVLHGGPLFINLKKEIENLDIFIRTIFSSKKPFRLSGFSKKLDSGTVLVAGLDLHNGDDFNLEVTPNWIRVYLPEGACGNTIMRFICNLQRYYDANASLDGVEYGKII